MALLAVALLWIAFFGFVVAFLWLTFARGDQRQHPPARFVGGRPTKVGLPIIKPKDHEG
jgi:hypothetical protein